MSVLCVEESLDRFPWVINTILKQGHFLDGVASTYRMHRSYLASGSFPSAKRSEHDHDRLPLIGRIGSHFYVQAAARPEEALSLFLCRSSAPRPTQTHFNLHCDAEVYLPPPQRRMTR
jgi:hypothetical protein